MVLICFPFTTNINLVRPLPKLHAQKAFEKRKKKNGLLSFILISLKNKNKCKIRKKGVL